MKLASWFSIALALACNETSSIGQGTLAGGTPAVNTAPGPTDAGGNAPSADGSGGGATTPSGTLDCVFDIQASEANNYELVTTFGFDVTHVAPNVDLTFDWSGVTEDFFGRSLDPKTDIGRAELSLVTFKVTPEQLAEQFMQLSTETVDFLGLDTMGSLTRAGTEDFDVQVKLVPEIDSVLADFDGIPFAGYPYLLSIATTSAGGNEIRMFAPFVLDFATKNTSVVMTSSSTTLATASSLSALTPVHVRPHDPHELLDWSQLATDVFGRDFPRTLREVRISEHSAALDDLAGDVMGLDAVADHVWRAPVGSETTLDLSMLTDDDGQPFPGIEPTGHTWLVALYADDVLPAPVFLTRLEPCGLTP